MAPTPTLKRGTNLSHWLSQADVMDLEGLETRVVFDDFARMASYGADHVRLPVDFELIESPEPPHPLLESGLIYVDRAVAWARRAGLCLSLDLHKAPGMSFNTPDENEIWTRPDLQERFAAIWRGLAERYHGAEFDHVAFELLNEPTASGPQDWNRLARTGLEAVRSVDAERTVLITSNSWGSVSMLPELEDFGDAHVIYTFHDYEPFIFTHQKASWVKHLVLLDLEVDYPTVLPDLSEAAAAMPTEEMREQTLHYSGATLDKGRIEQHLKPALEFRERTGRPLYCGEFGVIRNAPIESQQRWLRDTVDLFEKHDIGWANWDYKGGFGLLTAERETRPTCEVLFPASQNGWPPAGAQEEQAGNMPTRDRGAPSRPTLRDWLGGLAVFLLIVLIASAVAYVRWRNHQERDGDQAGAAPALRLVQQFVVEDVFGVRHPDQIIDFDLAKPVDPGNAFMLGPDGAETPFQIIEGGTKVAVQTDLPDDARVTWTLMAGEAPAGFEGGVEVGMVASGYEITNGLTGVRIAGVPAKPEDILAPIQAIRYRDGTWTQSGPVLLNVSGKPKSMNMQVLERGPLKAVVEVTYVFDRADLRYGNELLIPAGEGHYRCRIEVQAGQPSILIEDEADTDVSYRLDCWNGLEPNQARYRGHHAGRKEHGYEAGGGVYRMWHTRKPMDAFFDLRFDRLYGSSYCTNLDKWPSMRRMAVWDPWAVDSGWYWMMYDAKAEESRNLLGIFAGRASRALGAASSGAGFYTGPSPKEGGDPVAGIEFQINRRSPSARVVPRVRLAWGIFVGTTGEDLAPPDQVQPIARQMNLHGGVNLNKIHRLELAFADPPQGYGAMFMPAEAREALIAKLRQDTKGPHAGGFHGYLYHAEPYARPLVDFWHDTSGQKVQEVVGSIDNLAHDLLDEMVNGDGIYSFPYHYWHGGLAMSRMAVWMDQALAGDVITEQERADIKAAAVLFASVLWDDDFVPLFKGHALNLGTPNMPVQQESFRNMYALFLARHPMMQERAGEVWDDAREMLHETINEHGAHMGSVHYVGASNGPLLTLLQQLKMTGIKDGFREEPRLAAFGEFYMNLLTPPEPRFGGVRKLVAVGDGSTESSEEFGQLGTAMADVDADLSARLMGAWRQSGRTHSGFHGTTFLKIDERLPDKDPALGSATFPGWYTVLRSGWGTPNETAVWLVDGGFYSDHYHNDLGSVVIYALGAPLSVDWGPIYYPRVAGGFMHNVVLPEDSIGHPWDKADPSLEAGPRWRGPAGNAFLSFKNAALARCAYRMGEGIEWTRTALLLHANEERPVLVLRDTFGGEKSGGAKVLTLNLMAQGDVATPAGAVTPPPRSYFHDKEQKELASAGKVFDLTPGAHRLSFEGQWLIDWDLYLVAGEAQKAHVGNWAHHWHPSPEQAQFQKANERPFEERQHILRVRGTGPFTTVILPFRKGQKLEAKVAQQAGGLTVEEAGEAIVVDAAGYGCKADGKVIVASLGEAEMKAHGVTLSGGPIEVMMEGEKATLTAHGAAGERHIVLPAAWEAQAPLRVEDGVLIWDYRGGAPASVELKRANE